MSDDRSDADEAVSSSCPSSLLEMDDRILIEPLVQGDKGNGQETTVTWYTRGRAQRRSLE